MIILYCNNRTYHWLYPSDLYNLGPSEGWWFVPRHSYVLSHSAPSMETTMRVHNVDDRRRSWVGSWDAEPLDYDKLGPEHVGRTVIYRDHGRAEAGVISSWRDGTVFARYSLGDTAAGARAADLVLGVRPLDGPGSEPDAECEAGVLHWEAPR